MAARFAEPTEAEIVALLEKATPENTKKGQLNMELKFVTESVRKWTNISSNYEFRTNIETFMPNSGVCFTN